MPLRLLLAFAGAFGYRFLAPSSRESLRSRATPGCSHCPATRLAGARLAGLRFAGALRAAFVARLVGRGGGGLRDSPTRRQPTPPSADADAEAPARRAERAQTASRTA